MGRPALNENIGRETRGGSSVPQVEHRVQKRWLPTESGIAQADDIKNSMRETQMAYVRFEAKTDVSRFARSAVAPELSPLERSVIFLSLNDPKGSVHAPTSAARLFERLFGLRRAHGMADPRLEALRRYAVGYRTKPAAKLEGDRNAALSAGLTVKDLAQARALIDAQDVHPSRSGINPYRLGYVIASVIFLAWLFATLARDTGDPLIAIILVGIAMIIILSATPRRASR